MKERIKAKVGQISQSQKTREAIKSLKPQRSIWGFIGVVFFFILPEIIAFIWGAEITAYAKSQLPLADSTALTYCYELLIALFEEGGSWVNLAIGFGFLVWLFY